VFTALSKSLLKGSGSLHRLLTKTSAIKGAVVNPRDPKQVRVETTLLGNTGALVNGLPTPSIV